MLIILQISGLLFISIFILYNLDNKTANRIKQIIDAPFKLLIQNQNISGLFRRLNEKIISPYLKFLNRFFVLFLAPACKNISRLLSLIGSSLFKFESIEMNKAFNNFEESFLFIGLIARKIQAVNTRTYSAYILLFFILFYFIFRSI